MAASKGITATSKELGISRFSLYEWRRKVRLAADGKGSSPVSGPDPKDIEARRDREILSVWNVHTEHDDQPRVRNITSIPDRGARIHVTPR